MLLLPQSAPAPVSDSDSAGLTQANACFRDRCPPMLGFNLSQQNETQLLTQSSTTPGVTTGDGNTHDFGLGGSEFKRAQERIQALSSELALDSSSIRALLREFELHSNAGLAPAAGVSECGHAAVTGARHGSGRRPHGPIKGLALWRLMRTLVRGATGTAAVAGAAPERLTRRPRPRPPPGPRP